MTRTERSTNVSGNQVEPGQPTESRLGDSVDTLRTGVRADSSSRTTIRKMDGALPDCIEHQRHDHDGAHYAPMSIMSAGHTGRRCCRLMLPPAKALMSFSSGVKSMF